jgi:rubrerythrin
MVYVTESNLQEAFGGESKANRRYIFFAEKAEKDGYPQVARLFRAVAELFDASKPLDLILLRDELIRQGNAAAGTCTGVKFQNLPAFVRFFF